MNHLSVRSTVRDWPALVSAVALNLLTIPLLAQDRLVETHEPDVIDEIVVTATKRALPVQDVPFNISAFEEQRLREGNIFDIRRLSHEVPGLNYIDYGAEQYGDLIMRGMNATRLNVYDRSRTTGVYLNDTLLDYTHIDVNDIARIEVLRGPQGTLYGAGAVGGTIRFVTNKPDPYEYSGWIEAGWSNLSSSRDSGRDTKAMLNIPLLDGDLALRVSASYLDVPGYITKVGYIDRPGLPETMKRDQNSNERLNTRAALRWLISGQVETTLTYSGQRFDTKGNGAATPGVGDDYTGLGGIVDEYIDEDVDLYSLDIVADIGFAELTSNTAYYEERRLRLDDLTRYILEYSESSGLNYELYPEFFIATDGSHRTERFTQELRLVSATPDSLIDYVAGVFYLDQRDEGGPNRMPAPGLSGFLNELYFGPGEESGRPDDHYLLGHGETDATELAIYGEATVNLGDRWDIMLGGRWFDYETNGYTDTAVPTWEELFHKWGQPGCAPMQGGTDPTLFPCTHGHTAMDTELSDFVQKLGVSYQFSKADALLFVTIAEGYRPGGANYVDSVTVQIIDPRLLSYDPDKATSYEIGVKSMLLDHRLKLNASIYHLDWEDVQLTTGLSGVEWILNGGDARINGVEIDLTAILSDSFSADLTFSRLDAELTEDTLQTPEADGHKGDRLPGSAELQANLALRYETELGDNTRWWTRLLGSYSGDVNAYLNDNQVNQLIDPPVLSENRFFEQMPSYTVWNLGTGFEWNEWAAFAYIDNLFDERYIVATSTFEQGPVEDPISRQHYYGRPRTFGVSIRYDF